MRRLRFQFSLRMLLVLVTLSAVAVDFHRRRGPLLKKARYHNIVALVLGMDSGGLRPKGPPSAAELESASRIRAAVEFHQRLADKYYRTAWIPWIPVEEESRADQP